MRRNETYDVHGIRRLCSAGIKIKVDGDQVVVEGNHIHDVHTPADARAQFSDMSVSALLRNNHIHHIPDDCADLKHSSGTRGRDVPHRCSNKGDSVRHPGVTTLLNSSIYNCIAGIALKSDRQSTKANITRADCGPGMALYEEHQGKGGGQQLSSAASLGR